MAGLSSVLNIAKEALLAQQLSMQVTSNNVANVDTPGYTRQVLTLQANPATPSPVGDLGNGVHGQEVVRQYDQFMTQQIMKQQSTLGSLGTQQQSLQVLDTTFNEAADGGLNNLMNQFWSSWQELANNPEQEADRQSVVQQGGLLAQQFQNMNSQITQMKYSISDNMAQAVSSVNSLASQIASLNVDITAAESQNNNANDLRDQRDDLLSQLSKLVNVNYFEDKTGAYTVLLSDGHSLVSGSKSSKVEWSDNTLYWDGTNANGQQIQAALGSGADLGGQIGGSLQVLSQLAEGNPDNYLGKLDALANSLIREVNQQYSQGVGTTPFSGKLTGTATAADTAVLATTVDASQASTSIPAGTFEINGRSVGEIAGGGTTDGLAMTKAANAVQAINDAVTGVTAKLTTQVAGDAVSTLAPTDNGKTISFSVNGISVDYTVDTTDADAAGNTDTDPATFAGHLAKAINDAINTYNSYSSNQPKVNVNASVGDGTNGGVANALLLQNNNAGDASPIVIGDITVTDPVGGPTSDKFTGLTAGTYSADATHNTGEITLFSPNSFTVKAGTDDTYLAQLGMTDVSSNDQAGDGQFTFSYQDMTSQEPDLLQGLPYANELNTSGSFDIWLYNSDGSLALPQPVNVSLQGTRTLDDVANDINAAITNAGGQAGWLKASVTQGQLVLTPDANHQFAFANDTSNLLQVAGLNTFFTGSSAATLGVNPALADDLSLVAAGKVNDQGQINQGNGDNALAVSNLQNKTDVQFTGGTTDTLDDFYNALVGQIGTDSQAVNQSQQFATQVNTQLNQLRDATSGVSLDEEMTNLIKYQQAYSAAAKLVTTSDQMMQSLLAAVAT